MRVPTLIGACVVSVNGLSEPKDMLKDVQRGGRKQHGGGMVAAKLLRAKRDVRYVEISGDDHGLSGASTRTQVLKEIETFLAQSLGK